MYDISRITSAAMLAVPASRAAVRAGTQVLEGIAPNAVMRPQVEFAAANLAPLREVAQEASTTIGGARLRDAVRGTQQALEGMLGAPTAHSTGTGVPHGVDPDSVTSARSAVAELGEAAIAFMKPRHRAELAQRLDVAG